MKKLRYHLLAWQAAFFAGVLIKANDAQAGANFSDIARNINDSIEELPGLISSVSYMIGLLLGVLGILKIKDHVENPTQTPLKEGAIRLAAGGALFGLPIVFEAMSETIGSTSNFVGAAEVNRAEFNLR